MALPSKKKDDGSWTRTQSIIIAVLYGSYIINMMSSTGVSISLPLMVADGTLTSSQRSRLLSDGLIGYLIGKLVSGNIADYAGGHRVVPVSTICIAVCMACISRSRPSKGYLPLYWFIARIFSASLWPAMGLLCRQFFTGAQFPRAWGLLATSSRTGAVIGGLILSPLLNWGWRTVMWTTSYLSIAAAFISFTILGPSSTNAFGYDSSESRKIHSRPHHRPTSSNEPLSPILLPPPIRSIFSLLLFPNLWLVLIMETCLLLMLDIGTIIPTFLTEVAGLSTSVSARASASLPTGSTLGILIGSYLHGRFNPLGRAIFFTACMIISLLCLLLLSQPSYASSPRTAIYLLFFYGMSMSPPKYLIAPIFCAVVGEEKRTATLLSLMDVPGFLLTSIFYRHWHEIAAIRGSPGEVDSHTKQHDPTIGVVGNSSDNTAGWSMVFRLVALANAIALIAYLLHVLLEVVCSPSTTKASSSQDQQVSTSSSSSIGEGEKEGRSSRSSSLSPPSSSTFNISRAIGRREGSTGGNSTV